MAQKITYNIDVNPGNSVQTLGQLEDELAQINDELKGVDINSQSFQDLTKQSQALTRELDKANLAIAGVTDEDRVRGFQGAIDIVGGSVSALTGAVGLLGIENEEFEKFTAYAANAIAFSSGLRTLAQGAVDLRNALLKSTAAQNLFNLSVLRNPYVAAAAAIIATLTAVLAFSKDIRVAIGLQAEDAEDVTAEFEAQRDASDDTLELLKAERGLLEVQGEDLKDINKLIRDELDLQIDITEQLLLQAELELEQSKKEDKRLGFWDALGIKAKSYFGLVNENEAIVDAVLGKGVSDETLAISDKLQELRLKLLNLRKEVAEEDNKEIERRQVSTVSKIKDIEGFAGKQAEIFEESAKITTSVSDAVSAAYKKNAKDNIQAARDQNAADEARQRVLLETAGALGGLSQALGQGTDAGKAAAIAEIALTTGIGFAKALEIAQKSAAAAGPGAAFAFPIFYATQIAAVLGAIGQAKEIISGVQGGPAVPTVNVGTRGTTTSFAGPPQQPTDFGLSPETAGFNSPVRAYVVSGDVTTSQEADAKLNAKRTLGS